MKFIGDSSRVLARIVLFIIYYLLLVVLGLALFVAAFFITKYLGIFLLTKVTSGKAIVLGVAVILGVWCLAGMFGIYLIKPLFSFTKSKNKERVEITEKDCPELFHIIYDLADSVKCKKPKHVYLTTSVNACVFYNTSFWSIFFPVRKNLEIGLGLFDGTSIEEVKSVLAHEFGHFSQKSMKVGSTVYVTNSVLYNLIYEDDWWNNLLDKWQRSDTSVFRFFGNITRALTNGIKKLNAMMYRFVQKAYLKLSRQMEFDADTISCSIVGKESFISAMCKIEILSDEDVQYRDYLSALLRDNKIVGNYFAARAVADKLHPDKNIPRLQYNIPMSQPYDNVKSPSRVEVKNIWASHPDLKDRISNATKTGYVSNSTVCYPSWSLISDDIKEKVSNRLFSLIQQDPEHPLTVIDNQEFEKWATEYISDTYIPLRLKPFLNRDITSFDKEKQFKVDACPITEENAQILSDYETAKNDLHIIQGVIKGEIPAKELSYDGVVYKKKNIPISEQEEYVRNLSYEAEKIDLAVYSWLLSTVQEDERVYVLWAYDALFYINVYYPQLKLFQQRRDEWYEELSRPVRRDEYEYKNTCCGVAGFEKTFRSMIERSRWDILRVEVGDKAADQMLEYAGKEHNTEASLNVDEINLMFQMVDVLVNMHLSLYGRARKTIGKLLEKTVDL